MVGVVSFCKYKRIRPNQKTLTIFFLNLPCFSVFFGLALCFFFLFCLETKEKEEKRKIQGCVCFPTRSLRSANDPELASLRCAQTQGRLNALLRSLA